MGTEQLDAKSLRRWLALYGYFDALLSWHGRRRKVPPVIAPATCFGDRVDSRRGIKPVTSRGSAGGAYASRAEPSRASRIGTCRIQICVTGAPSRPLSLRAPVGELIWEANTSAGQ